MLGFSGLGFRVYRGQGLGIGFVWGAEIRCSMLNGVVKATQRRLVGILGIP